MPPKPDSTVDGEALRGSVPLKQDIAKYLNNFGAYYARCFNENNIVASGDAVIGATNDMAALIATQVAEARLDELLRCRDSWHGTDDREFAKLMNKRYAQLTGGHNE